MVLHRCIPTLAETVGGSFNGRTADSDSVDQGSNPCPPAIKKWGFDCIKLNPRYFISLLKYVSGYFHYSFFSPFPIILAQESRSVTVLLNTRDLSEESTESVKKYPSLSNWNQLPGAA
jgi:hypothetical protein